VKAKAEWAQIDEKYEALHASADAVLSKHSEIVRNDTIATHIVTALKRAYETAPNVKIVLVLNSCNLFSSQKIQEKATTGLPAKIHGQRCVLNTTLQWPGSLLPRLIPTMLVSAMGGAENQK